MASISKFLAYSVTAISWLALSSHAQETNITGPVAAPFYSRPDLDSIVLNVTRHNDSLISPGYIFLAPYQVLQPGPYIFDNQGNLVWSGFAQAGPSSSHDFRACQYNGSDHLCMFQGTQALGYARGHGLIMDNAYSIVKSVQTGGGLPPADQHEFAVINNGKSALMTIFHPVPSDLAAYNITGGQGWIMEGIFQEVEVATSKVLFEWRSLNHVDPSAGFVLPNTTDVSGDGTTKDSPWDYFHINAVDKTPEGDYLVSGRHTEAIYKISGVNGSVLWQLGGKESSFTQSNFNFSYQHDVRFISDNSTTMIISLFDNAYNGYNSSADYSQGKVIALDNSTMTATLLQSYGNPHPFGDSDPSGGLLAASQGNLQFLANGNAFLGWGNNAFISESTPDGTPVLSAYFATTGALHYRAYKFNFTGIPNDAPALYTYAHNDSAPITYYTSWNGATEVASWTFYSGSSPNGLKQVGNAAKNGFETVASVPSFYAYTIVAAVAKNGTELRNSTVISTFVPGSALAKACTDVQCPLIGGYQIQPDVLALTTAPVAPNAPTATDGELASSSPSSSSKPTSAASPQMLGSSKSATVFFCLAMVLLL